MRTVLVLGSDQLGSGDRALGQRLLGTFLRKSIALEGLDAIAFFNHGVRLLTASSPVLAELTLLEENGVDLLPCGTCVDALGLELAVGTVSDMDTILLELSKAEKVVTL